MELKKLEPLFDEFVYGIGGERIDRIIQQPQGVRNADYYFHRQGYVAELKCLEIDSFGANYQRQMNALVESWILRGLLVDSGTIELALRKVPSQCQEEWMRLIERPLQKHVITSANSQIKESKELLGIPEAKGIVLVASDGNTSLQPYAVLFSIDRILRKKKATGERQYSSIDGVCYFSLNMQVRVPGLPVPAVFWCGGPRDQSDDVTRAFCDDLDCAWHRYQCRIAGIEIPRFEAKSTALQNLTFVK